MRIIIAVFIKIPCAECKERPCFTRYNFAPKAGLERGGRFCAECRLGSNAAHEPLVDEHTCPPYARENRYNFQLEYENVLYLSVKNMFRWNYRFHAQWVFVENSDHGEANRSGVSKHGGKLCWINTVNNGWYKDKPCSNFFLLWNETLNN